MIKVICVLFLSSTFGAALAQAENSMAYNFDFVVENANRQSVLTLAPVLNSIVSSGASEPTKANPNVQCEIVFTKFDNQKSYSGIALPVNTLRVQGQLTCVDEKDSMAPAILAQQMRKWVRVDISDATNVSLHFIQATGPSVSGSN